MNHFVRSGLADDRLAGAGLEWLVVAAINVMRVALCCAWTIVVGLPLIAVIHVRYGFAVACGRAGNSAAHDRLIEGNAFLAGWVAQRLWANVVLAILEVPLRVVETEPVDWAASHVVCANHASLLDIFALIRAVPPPFRFVAKRELTRWPIVGWALRPAGQIVVDRSDRQSAIASLDDAAARRIRGQVIFFVEGTRSRSGRLGEFKKGAFHFSTASGLPVLPVAICGSHSALARQPWWALRSGRPIEVRFCNVEPSSVDARGAPATEGLRERTRAAIAQELEHWQCDWWSTPIVTVPAAEGRLRSRPGC